MDQELSSSEEENVDPNALLVEAIMENSKTFSLTFSAIFTKYGAQLRPNDPGAKEIDFNALSDEELDKIFKEDEVTTRRSAKMKASDGKMMIALDSEEVDAKHMVDMLVQVKKEINWDMEERVYMTQHQKKQDAILIGSEDDSSDEAEATTPMLSTCLKAPIKRCYSDSECDGGPHSGYVTPAPTNKCSEFSGDDDDDDDDGKDGESEYEPLKSQAIKMEPVTPRMTLCHRRGHGAVSRDEVGGMKRHHCSEEEGEEGDTSLTTTSGTPLPKRSRSGHLNDGTEEDSDHHAGELGPDELSTEHCEVDEGNSDHATYDVFLGIFTPDLVPRSRDTVPRSRGTVSGSHDTPFRRKASCDSTTTTTPRRLLTGGRRKSQLVSARPSKARDDPPVSRDHPHVSRELKISDTPPGSPETPPTAASSSVLVMSPMLSHVLLEGSVAWGPAGSSGGSCLVPSGGFGSYGDGTLHAACKSPMPPPAHQCHVSTRLRSSPSPSSPEPNSTGQPSGCSATPTGLLCSTSPPGCYPPPVHSSSIKHHTPCVLSSPGLCFSQCSHHPHHCTAALLSCCCCCCCCCRHHCRCHLHTCHTHSHLPSPPPHSHQVNGAVTPHAVG